MAGFNAPIAEVQSAPVQPHPEAIERFNALVHELYPPVSALGDEIDRLSTGAFEDEELTALLAQMRAGVDHLSRLVVLLKGYAAERGAVPDGSVE